MPTDLVTQRQAFIIAKQYNFCPQEPLKCERTVPTTAVRSLFFANTSNRVKVLIQYDRDELDPPE